MPRVRMKRKSRPEAMSGTALYRLLTNFRVLQRSYLQSQFYSSVETHA